MEPSGGPVIKSNPRAGRGASFSSVAFTGYLRWGVVLITRGSGAQSGQSGNGEPPIIEILSPCSKLTFARVFPGGHMGQTPETLPTIINWLKNELS